MIRFVHISDPHLSEDYSGMNIMMLCKKTGITLTEQLSLGMEHINRHYPDVDFFLLTGDIVQDGKAGDYARFRRHIDGLTGGRPCYVTTGNHDTDAFWQGWFGEPRAGTFDYAAIDEKSGLKIISLDSRGGPYGSGILSAAQLDWLRGQTASGEPCIILTHHTPHIGGDKYLIYQMQSSHGFYDAVREGNVLGIFSGHTHIRFESLLGGIPCHTAQSITFGLITDEHAMTATDKTGYNYCEYFNGRLTVQNIELPGTGASSTLSFEELIAQRLPNTEYSREPI